MAGQDIIIHGPDGDFSAYKTGEGPVLIVLQEIFGVNQVMRDLCDEYAAQGFTAVCPDLFWRIEPGIQITDKTEEEWNQAFELFGKFDVDAGIRDVAATIAQMRAEGADKVGAVGYCLGGQLAYLTACRTDADACVGYYGVNIQERLDEASRISHPLMLHIAGKDEFVPAEAQGKIMDALSKHGLVTIHHYPEWDHAFARPGGAHYDADDAELANGRSLNFLNKNLK